MHKGPSSSVSYQWVWGKLCWLQPVQVTRAVGESPGSGMPKRWEKSSSGHRAGGGAEGFTLCSLPVRQEELKSRAGFYTGGWFQH